LLGASRVAVRDRASASRHEDANVIQKACRTQTGGDEEPDLPAFAAGAVTVTFSADDVVKSSVTPKLGVPVPVEIDLTNVLRLRIDVTGGAFSLPDSGVATVVAFGDARLTPKP